MPLFTTIFHEYGPLQQRRTASVRKALDVRKNLDGQSQLFLDGKVAAYLAGSIGRGDVGELSDIDLFLVRKRPKTEHSYLDDLEVLACAINANRELSQGVPFSNDGQYLKVYRFADMLEALGAPQDDSENLFTARMLLLLESRCVSNDKLYAKVIEKIVGHYFRDSRGKQSFRPLFLLNDILRYWRTLCLNYELIRDRPDRPWGKKNINLKFSRALTVFATVLPLIAKPGSNAKQVKKLVKLSPHERFARGLDLISDLSLEGEYRVFLADYERFLRWKEDMGSQQELQKKVAVKSRESAERFLGFIYKTLTHKKIDDELRRFLVI